MDFSSKYSSRYPLSSKYDINWVFENQMGPNVLWLLESLCEKLAINSEMKVLDLGCGKAISSIFLSDNFNPIIFAHDLWIQPSENYGRIVKHGKENRIFPIYGNATELPYSENYFDAVISIDAFQYFGVENNYIGYLGKFVKQNGHIGIVVPGFTREFDENIPEYLKPFAKEFRTTQWWKNHIGQNEAVTLEHIDVIETGHEDWLDFVELQIKTGVARDRDESDYQLLSNDKEKDLCFIRMVIKIN